MAPAKLSSHCCSDPAPKPTASHSRISATALPDLVVQFADGLPGREELIVFAADAGQVTGDMKF